MVAKIKIFKMLKTVFVLSVLLFMLPCQVKATVLKSFDIELVSKPITQKNIASETKCCNLLDELSSSSAHVIEITQNFLVDFIQNYVDKEATLFSENKIDKHLLVTIINGSYPPLYILFNKLQLHFI